jgi:protein O-mannosyl-transferase
MNYPRLRFRQTQILGVFLSPRPAAKQLSFRDHQRMSTRSRKPKKIRRGNTSAPWMQIVGVSISLIAIIWLVFGETLHHPSINFDDPGYVFENPQITAGLTSAGVLWAFTHSHMQNWHPLTWISHMLDCQFFGLNAGGHHFTNVLLHTIAAILLFLVFQKMTGALWRSAFVAALFAIHPLRVESVAWIAERKDVLSGVFFMVILGAYVRYVRKPSGLRYLVVVLLFALGLMAKPMLVTLPFVLLLLDYWPLGRLAYISSSVSKTKTRIACQRGQGSIVTQLILEKVPLLFLSAVSSIITLFAQREIAVPMGSLPVSWRINNALVSYVAYIWQMICPVRLALVYPHPEYLLSSWEVVAAIAFLAGATALVLTLRKAHRYLITGWFWYLGMLVPVIGIMQVGVQARADRYTYLPQIGLYLMATWTIADWSTGWRYRRQILVVAAAILIGALAWSAWVQDSYWRDSETLWTRTLAVTSHNDVAHASLASLFLKDDRIDDAISHSEAAVRIQPDNVNARDTLARCLFRRGRVNEAVAHLKETLRIAPDDDYAQANLAWVLATSPDASLRDGTKALELAKNLTERPGHANDANAIQVLQILAAACAETGRFPEAVRTAQQALQLAIAQNNAALTESLQSNIDNYRRNLPWRDAEAVNKAQ